MIGNAPRREGDGVYKQLLQGKDAGAKEMASANEQAPFNLLKLPIARESIPGDEC